MGKKCLCVSQDNDASLGSQALCGSQVSDGRSRLSVVPVSFGGPTLEEDIQSSVWDEKKHEAEYVSELYSTSDDARVRKWGERIRECGHTIRFTYTKQELGWKRRLHSAHLCRVRTCPICAWRRSLRLAGELARRLSGVFKGGRSLRPVLLTLTVKNCSLDELHDTASRMLKGWSRLTRRKEFIRHVAGWVRSLEVTGGDRGVLEAHPHIHALLLVDSEFSLTEFSKYWWAEKWGAVAKLSYLPVCDVREVTSLDGAINEVSKYMVKPYGEVAEDRRWLPRVALELHRVRAVATGGLLKDADVEGEEEDFTLVSEPPSIPGERPEDPIAAEFIYIYDYKKKRYRRFQSWWELGNMERKNL